MAVPRFLLAGMLLLTVCRTQGQSNPTMDVTRTYFGVSDVYVSLLESGPIKLDTPLMAQMRLVHDADFFTNPDIESYCKIEGRGMSTWRTFEKKPYNIDLITASGYERKLSLLDMPAHDEWALIANHTDKTFLRQQLAYYLGSLFMDWAPRTRFVRLYLDEEYQGLYLLCEKVSRSKNRLDLQTLEQKAEDQIEPNLGGGYILELERPHRFAPGDPRVYTQQTYSSQTTQTMQFSFKYPKRKNVTTAQVNWINDYMQEFEEALFSTSFTDSQKGYRAWADAQSFADWFIINELAKNNDAKSWASIFYHKSRYGLLEMGPVWDFDIGFGNINFVSDENDCSKTHGFHIRYNTYLKRMFDDPYFARLVRDRFMQMLPVLEQVPDYLRTMAQVLSENGAVDDNFNRWPVLGFPIWPNPVPVPGSYDAEVLQLADWIEERVFWLRIQLQVSDADKCTQIQQAKTPVTYFKWSDSQGTHEQLSTLSDAEFTYKWSNGSTNSNLESPPHYTPYTVQATYLGCKAMISDPVQLPYETIPVEVPEFPAPYAYQVNPATGIDDVASGVLVQVYPNPASETLWLKTLATGRSQVKVFTLSGMLMYQTGFEGETTVAIYDWPAGLYLVQLITPQGMVTTKIEKR